MSSDSTSSQRHSEGMMRPRASLVSFIQRLVDAGLIGLCLWLPSLIYSSWAEGNGKAWDPAMTAALALAILGFTIFASNFGLYRSWRGWPVRDEAASLLATWTSTIPGLLLVGFLTKTTDHFSRIVITAWLVAFPLVGILARIISRRTLRYLRKHGHNLRRVAIVGATEAGVQLAQKITEMPETGNRVVGFFDDRDPKRLAHIELGEHKVRGGMKKLVEKTRTGEIEVIYVALPLRAERRIRDIISRLADTTATVYILTPLFMFDLMHARWGTVADMPVVSVFDTPFEGLGGSLKRLEDIVLSTLILALVALPMIFIALGVKLTSKGPVFFRQTRYGLNGQPIRVFKFRTMTTMEDGAQVMQAKKDDKRVTRFGAFLRRTSLDELPQFFNVLTGEMSVVGPRPHAVAHNELYRKKIRGYMLRHKVKPGITGWAQVNGWRGETEVLEKMEQRVEHDLYYIDNWSLLWDLQIVFLTVFGKRVRANAF